MCVGDWSSDVCSSDLRGCCRSYTDPVSYRAQECLGLKTHSCNGGDCYSQSESVRRRGFIPSVEPRGNKKARLTHGSIATKAISRIPSYHTGLPAPVPKRAFGYRSEAGTDGALYVACRRAFGGGCRNLGKMTGRALQFVGILLILPKF